MVPRRLFRSLASPASITFHLTFSSEARSGILADVYRTRHDRELAGASYGTFVKADGRDGGRGSPGHLSFRWIVGFILYSIGLQPWGTSIVHSRRRPWTRQDCARLVKEAGVRMDRVPKGWRHRPARIALYGWNFAPELHDEINTRFRCKSRICLLGVLGIAGPPLTDGYDFGETITNNFGRPYGEGFNGTAGSSVRFVAGPFGAYVRGEYQHGAAPMNLSLAGPSGYPRNRRARRACWIAMVCASG